MKVVIIGGVAGGATAAARIRRLDEKAEVVVFEKSGYISYANCGLPYYVGGVITDREELTLQTPESFWQRFRIDMRVMHEVIKIEPEMKEVHVRNLVSGEVFREKYDKLLISTGARPVMPELPGMDDQRFFTLRTVEDTFRIKEYVDANKPESAAIIGGGFIGIEVAENLRNLGMKTTIIQRPQQLLNPLDKDMAAFLHGEMRAHGVELLLGRNVEGFGRKPVDDAKGSSSSSDAKGSGASPQRITVKMDGGSVLETDMVVMAIGVAPDSALAADAGLETGIKGSIVVNERMETSAADIYAVGDAVEVKHFITGEKALISLAGPANKQGRIAADNICGGDSVFKGSQGSSVIKVFDMTAASTGINEKTAKAAGIDYDKVYLAPMSHAGYYPGGSLMSVKVLFQKNTYKLLGAQIVGYQGVDKRIDVLATAMHAGLDALSLKDLDLAYAPPYSSAKDPVNMAGFMIENISEGLLKQFFWEEIDGLPRDGSVILLDTRTPLEYGAGHIDGFINIPVDDLRSRADELEKGKKIYVHCQSGLRSYIACRILEQMGFECYNLSGGYRLYEAVMNDSRAARQAMPCGMEK